MTTAEREVREIVCNLWAEELYQFPSPYDYRVIKGGAGNRPKLLKSPARLTFKATCNRCGYALPAST